MPGAVVADHLFNQVQNEWKDKKHGLKLAVERTSKLAVTLKNSVIAASILEVCTGVIKQLPIYSIVWMR